MAAVESVPETAGLKFRSSAQLLQHTDGIFFKVCIGVKEKEPLAPSLPRSGIHLAAAPFLSADDAHGPSRCHFDRPIFAAPIDNDQLVIALLCQDRIESLPKAELLIVDRNND